MTKNAGFTLIELLVVVLIIGVLSAVALPQYQKAVLKARVARALPLLGAIHKAQQVYYLANGHYTNDIEELDVSFAYTSVVNGASNSSNMMYKGSSIGTITLNSTGSIFWTTSDLYVDVYAKTGAHCYGLTKMAETVCASYGPKTGTSNKEGRYSVYKMSF